MITASKVYIASDQSYASSSVYCEALGLSEDLPKEEKTMATSQRILSRVGRLERAAMASHVFALIQYSRVSFPIFSAHIISHFEHIERYDSFTRRSTAIFTPLESSRGKSCPTSPSSTVVQADR